MDVRARRKDAPEKMAKVVGGGGVGRWVVETYESLISYPAAE